MEIPTPVMYFIQVKTRKYTALIKLRQNLGKFVKPELLVYLRLQIGYLHLIASPNVLSNCSYGTEIYRENQQQRIQKGA